VIIVYYRLGIVQGASHVFIAPVIAMMALTKCPEPEDISGMYCSVNMLLHKANNDIYHCNKFIKLKRGQLNSDSMEGRYKYVL
jgi:hypothetical protein